MRHAEEILLEILETKKFYLSQVERLLQLVREDVPQGDTLEKLEREIESLWITYRLDALLGLRDRLRTIRKHCYHSPNCRCFSHINEALNMGDGTYKP